MMEPERHSASRAWSWRHAIANSGLPPTTRHVLLTISIKMDETGGSCYPPITELVALTGLDKKTVRKHLEIAESKGWIEISQHGFRGQRWKRNDYVARWPGRDLAGTISAISEAEGGGATPPPSDEEVGEMVPEGGGIGSPKVGEPLPQDKILPANIPTNSPAAGAGERGLKKVDRKKIEREYTLWYATWGVGDVKFGENTWKALSDEEREECIRRTPDTVRRINKSDRDAAAVFLKNRLWRDVPEEVTSPPSRGIAKVCGKLWMGTRLAALSKEPTGRIIVTAFDERRVERGEIAMAALMAAKRKEHGWPLVTEMRDLARRAAPFVTSLELLPHVENFRQVKRESDLFAAWADLHERRGWPFLERPPEYVWLPPIPANADSLDEAVEEALTNFLSTISEAGHDDAV